MSETHETRTTLADWAIVLYVFCTLPIMVLGQVIAIVVWPFCMGFMTGWRGFEKRVRRT